MPYVAQEKRNEIVKRTANHLDFTTSIGINSSSIDTCGDLNFAFTVLAQDYLKRKGISYQHINDILGALDGASKELYRRIAVPYEDEKIKTNGDVREDLK